MRSSHGISKTMRPCARAVSVFALMTAASLMGCASATFIRSDPPGAALFVDDSKVGHTPYYYSDTRPAFSSVKLRLEKEGYEPFEVVLTRDETLEVANLFGALCCPIGLIFALGYHPEHHYVLKPLQDVPAEDWEKQLQPEAPQPGDEPLEDWEEDALPELPPGGGG